MKKKIGVLAFLFMSVVFAQQTHDVDFKNLNAAITIIPDSSLVVGNLTYNFKIIKAVDSIFIDAKNATFEAIELIKIHNNSEDVISNFNYAYHNNQLVVYHKFRVGEQYNIQFTYTAHPKKALYFLKRKEDWNIWTQGQGKYTSNWLPSFDDVNEKLVFNLTLTFDDNYTVLANGVLDSIQQNKGLKTWYFNMNKPISSYLVALAIGKYKKQTKTSKSGIPLEYYYFTEDSLKVEPTYRYSKKLFDFLEEEIGVFYPWDIYKQVPVYDFLYDGMENTSLTIFSEEFMVDTIGYNDKNYVNVNAHELAHHWFGNMVTAASGIHHWLQEGFATYYALLAEQYVFGEDYFYFKLYKYAQDLIRQDMAGNGTSLLNPKSSSLTFYQRGAWALHALRYMVGDHIFKKAVKRYLENHSFGSVKTLDFLSSVEYYYGKSLNKFVNNWIKNKDFPYEAAIRLIHKQSSYIQEYLEVDCEVYSSKCADYLKYYASDNSKIKVIAQQPTLVSDNTFNNSLKVRQAIATHLKYVPHSIKTNYESLLNDASYITIENALYNLWQSFPLERSKYLSKTRDIKGLKDNNVKLLWLVLHLNTPNYKVDNKTDIFSELLNYTYPHNPSSLRMKAFDYLILIDSCNAICKSNLEEAKSHHNWRMVKFAKNMLHQINTEKK